MTSAPTAQDKSNGSRLWGLGWAVAAAALVLIPLIWPGLDIGRAGEDGPRDRHPAQLPERGTSNVPNVALPNHSPAQSPAQSSAQSPELRADRFRFAPGFPVPGFPAAGSDVVLMPSPASAPQTTGALRRETDPARAPSVLDPLARGPAAGTPDTGTPDAGPAVSAKPATTRKRPLPAVAKHNPTGLRDDELLDRRLDTPLAARDAEETEPSRLGGFAPKPDADGLDYDRRNRAVVPQAKQASVGHMSEPSPTNGNTAPTPAALPAAANATEPRKPSAGPAVPSPPRAAPATGALPKGKRRADRPQQRRVQSSAASDNEYDLLTPLPPWAKRALQQPW